MSSLFELLTVSVVEQGEGFIVSYSLPSTGEVVSESRFGLGVGEGFIREYAKVDAEGRNSFIVAAEEAAADSGLWGSLVEGFPEGEAFVVAEENFSCHVEAAGNGWVVRLYELDTSYPYDEFPVFVKQYCSDWFVAAGLAGFFRSLDIGITGYVPGASSDEREGRTE